MNAKNEVKIYFEDLLKKHEERAEQTWSEVRKFEIKDINSIQFRTAYSNWQNAFNDLCVTLKFLSECNTEE